MTRGVPNDARHGTPAGWHAHYRRGETPCPACWQARHDYDERLRSAPDHVVLSRLRARAQRAAYVRLRAEHVERYRELYAEEKLRLLREGGHVVDPTASAGGRPDDRDDSS